MKQVIGDIPGELFPILSVKKAGLPIEHGKATAALHITLSEEKHVPGYFKNSLGTSMMCVCGPAISAELR